MPKTNDPMFHQIRTMQAEQQEGQSPSDDRKIVVARGPVVSVPVPVDLDAAFAERYGPDDDEVVDDTLVVDPPWREQFAAKVDAARKRDASE